MASICLLGVIINLSAFRNIPVISVGFDYVSWQKTTWTFLVAFRGNRGPNVVVPALQSFGEMPIRNLG
jgi:hypothetical protein